jgi:hypothetical protein
MPDPEHIQSHHANGNNDIQAILSMIPELNASLISKSQAEYLYTAASIGGFGAVSWGVGALRDGTAAPFFHPAIVALVGIAAVAASVIYKIFHDHKLYIDNQLLIVSLRRELSARLGGPTWLPDGLLHEETHTPFPSGYFVSILVICASALASGLFCLSIYLYGKP